MAQIELSQVEKVYPGGMKALNDLNLTVGEGEFIEVFVDAPLADCIKRDPKGLYAKAKAGTLKNFTGIDAPYEVPTAAELHLRTRQHSPEELADSVVAALRERGVCS